MKRLAFVAIAVLVVAGTVAAVRGGPAGEASAAEIVARNVAARGGLDAWRKVETMSWAGHIESARAPAPNLRFELEQRRPNKTRLQIHVPGGVTSMRVFDGVHGWKVSPAGGRAEPYTPQELMFARGGHGIDGPLIDHAAKGNSVTLESVDELGGRKAYHLSVHLAKGGKEDVWVDTETYLDVRYDRMADGPADAPRRVSVNYGDYRTVEGLKIPFLIETGVGSGATPDRMKIERVVVNAPLDDRVFTSPAGPHPRQAGRPGIAPRVAMPTASSSPPGSTGRGAGPP